MTVLLQRPFHHVPSLIRGLMLLICIPAVVARAAEPAAPAASPLPIVFVHGNGDDAAKWVPTIWLFESNGYPADRLFAIRFTNPAARTDDTVEEKYRSSTVDAVAELSAFVTRVLAETHGHQVILVGSSRGGMTIRNYLQNGGGRANVAAAILCGTPNHGVLASDENSNGEFNGKGTFLTALNKPNADGSETVPGVRMLTLRSDKLDKYAQPTAIASGHPETSTGVAFEGPALKGATNLVLPGMDHRELAFSRQAFAAMFEFITGDAPTTREVTSQAKPSLSGVITGYAGLVPTNQPLAQVHVSIHPIVGAISSSAAVYEKTTAEDGRWGPFVADPKMEYEVDLECLATCSSSGEPGADKRRVRYFVAALPRSTRLLNLRFLPVPKDASPASSPSGYTILVDRPQGYFSRERDPVLLNGQPVASEPAGLPIRDSFLVTLPDGNSSAEIGLRQEVMKLPKSSYANSDLKVVYFIW